MFINVTIYKLHKISCFLHWIIIPTLALSLSSCGDSDNKTTEKYNLINTSDDNQAHAGKAEDKSSDFLITVVGKGELSIPKSQTKKGPIIQILPQRDSLIANLDENSLFAVNRSGQKVKIRYFIPIELSNYTVKTSPTKLPTEGKYVAQETWIPKINTFTNRYNAFGTSDNQIFFVLEFIDKKTPIKFGIIFEEDYVDLAEINALGTAIKLEPATGKGA